jgi:radical SAM superfamily enzyme YgiQ (UPF0313 family)
MPHLLLINPSNKQKGLGNIKATAWPPLNLPYIAALTPDRYAITLIDENIEPFTECSADLVGITAYSSSVSRGYEIAQHCRSRGVPVVMGGIHVSMLPDEALRFCDAVVIGEAESVWGQLIQDFEAGCLKSKYQGQWQDLARLPVPRRDILKNSHYRWGSIQTSRGCPMNCDFCSVTAFNGNRFRRRPVDDVIAELQLIPQRFVLLVDDNIAGYGRRDAEWARTFFSEIIRRRINKIFFAQVSLNFGEDPELTKLAQRAGLRVVLVGMESINPRTLQAFNKQLNLKRLEEDRYPKLIRTIRSSGIAFLGAFMLGDDEDTPDVFPTTLTFIRKTGIDILQLTKPTPLPGTRFWDKLNRDRRIQRQDFPGDWDEYRLTKLVYEPRKMTREEVYRGFTHLRAAYYGRVETVRRTLKTLWDTRSLTATLLAYKFNASYRKAFFQSEHFQRFRGSHQD